MAIRTLDPAEQRRIERREQEWRGESKEKKSRRKRRKHESPPEFNLKDWK